jgi:general secretion pathway protein B
MSYILEALKKAEAERRSGAVPDVHAIAAPPSLPAQTPSTWRARWLWGALPLLAVLAAGFFWMGRSSDGVPQQPVLPVVAAPVQPEQIVPAAVIPVVEEKPAEELPKPAEKPPQVAVKKPVAKRPVHTAEEHKTAPPTKPAILAQRELPEHIQRELPPLTVSGYIYSGNKADRSVLLNKRLLREGDQVAPDLRLESLLQDGMVLNYKGYRYRASY